VHTLGRESLGLALELNLDEGVAVLVDDSERPVLHISLDFGIVEATTDETLSIEDGVLGVHSSLVLGSVTNKALVVREGNI
jgi:hypothetical protein